MASVHKGNTKKVVESIANVLNADIVNVVNGEKVDLSLYDNVIIASGVYFSKMHKSMMPYLKALDLKGKNCYLLLTTGSKSDYPKKISDSLSKELGIEIKSSFQCLGYDTYGPFKLIGGINKNRPNEADLNEAISWAKTIL